MIEVHNPLEDWQHPSPASLKTHARVATEVALEHLAESVRGDALATPGWEDFADRAGVHAAEGETYYGLAPDDPEQQKYFDREYGTEDDAPTGFLRGAASRHADEASGVLGSEMLGRVLG